MSIEEKVSLTISITKSYKDKLRIMAAEQNLQDPDRVTSASTIAREIICEHVDKIEHLEAAFEPAEYDSASLEKSERIKSSEVEIEKIGPRGD